MPDAESANEPPRYVKKISEAAPLNAGLISATNASPSHWLAGVQRAIRLERSSLSQRPVEAVPPAMYASPCRVDSDSRCPGQVRSRREKWNRPMNSAPEPCRIHLGKKRVAVSAVGRLKAHSCRGKVTGIRQTSYVRVVVLINRDCHCQHLRCLHQDSSSTEFRCPSR